MSSVAHQLKITSAIREGNLPELIKLYSHSDQTSLNRDLVLACRYSALKSVDFLVNKGADVNCDHGRPLKEAFKGKYYNMMVYLLEKGAKHNFSFRDNEKDTLLSEAVKGRNTKAIKILLNYGADTKSNDFYPLVVAHTEEMVNLISFNYTTDELNQVMSKNFFILENKDEVWMKKVLVKAKMVSAFGESA